jgi:hypothetical protein
VFEVVILSATGAISRILALEKANNVGEDEVQRGKIKAGKQRRHNRFDLVKNSTGVFHIYQT